MQDWARAAFAATEVEIFRIISKGVPAATLKSCRESAYRLRADGSATHLEWLKTPSKRHGPNSLAEVLEKIRYLKGLTAHEWPLDNIAIPKQRAYAQQMQARRPAKSKEIKDTTQTIELVCFLRMTLLELTDLAIQQGSRRSQKLFRDAAQKAQTSQGRSESAARQYALKARDVLRDEPKPCVCAAWRPIRSYRTCWIRPRAASRPRSARPWLLTSSGSRRFWAAWRASNLVGKPTTPVFRSGLLGVISKA